MCSIPENTVIDNRSSAADVKAAIASELRERGVTAAFERVKSSGAKPCAECRRPTGRCVLFVPPADRPDAAPVGICASDPAALKVFTLAEDDCTDDDSLQAWMASKAAAWDAADCDYKAQAINYLAKNELSWWNARDSSAVWPCECCGSTDGHCEMIYPRPGRRDAKPVFSCARLENEAVGPIEISAADVRFMLLVWRAGLSLEDYAEARLLQPARTEPSRAAAQPQADDEASRQRTAPCPRRCSVVFRGRTKRGVAALPVDCGKDDCPACGPRRRRLYTDTIRNHVERFAKETGETHVYRGACRPDQSAALAAAVRVAGGEYAAVESDGALLQVVSTVPLPAGFVAVRQVSIADAIADMEGYIMGAERRTPTAGEKPRRYRPSDGWPLLPDGRPARRDNEKIRAERKRIATEKATTYAVRHATDAPGGRLWLSFCSALQLAGVKRALHPHGGCARVRTPENMQPAGRDYAIISRVKPPTGSRPQLLTVDELVQALATAIDSAPLSELRRIGKLHVSIAEIQRIAEAQGLVCATEGRERRGKYSHGHRMLRIVVATADQEAELLLALGYVPDDEPMDAEPLPALAGAGDDADDWTLRFPHDLRT